MALLPLLFRRSGYVEKAESTVSQTSLRQTRPSGETQENVGFRDSNDIPSALSFDKILEGGTCPPCTLGDFMNYLRYVERSAENLQFFLWQRDYERRFTTAKTADVALAPEWTRGMEEDAIRRIKKEHSERVRQPPKEAVELFKGTDFEKGRETVNRPMSTASEIPRSPTSLAFASAGAKDPFTIQPFRREIDRIIATYIMDNAPRQLNLSDQERKLILQALSFTTHPSALRTIGTQIEATLRQEAHPNFIRWSISNGSPARMYFAFVLGTLTILGGFAAALALTLGSAGRGYRALAGIGWMMGFATVIAARKGMCLILHGLHRRHIRPWELFMSDADDEEAAISTTTGKIITDTFAIDQGMGKDTGFRDRKGSSHEDEPWVIQYRQRNVVRKIFDREAWVEEPALRKIQDGILVHSLILALLCTLVLTTVFVAVPAGMLF
ncbi:hypothetical protein B0J18DRAFT_102157 [Chaetomium sp. MPI-SDFR-AT-0129]|nr:hypothetical protein B0J18DRAFT_102157 [Chaetomium sp. MPI-SDFR-AT-0129]